jgi:integrase
MRKTLTDKGVAALKPRAKSYTFPDPELRAHYVRVQPTGAKSFVALARDPYGKQIWHTTGTADVFKIDEAREKAREAIKRIKAGLPPVEPAPLKPDTFRDVAENWIKRHVVAKKLRSEYEIKRVLEKYVFPKWAERDFTSIRRSDISALLDHIEDHHGSRMADLTLARVRSIANWYAIRNDSYASPFTRGMRRHSKPPRARILDDDELRAVWRQAKVSGQFGAVVQLLLLSAQRRQKIACMKWSDVDDDGVWTVASDAREKGNIGRVALPKEALDIIRQQPRLGANPYVFAGRGNSCIAGFGHSVRAFTAALPDMPHWTLHDLRRTSRSLLSRCGVSSEHAERIMGHAIPGIEGTYDRHSYDTEKKSALAKLAQLIDNIVNERKNVIPLAKRRRAKS